MSRDQQNNDRRLGRNFRRIIDAEVRLKELETTLAKASGIAECWDTMRAFSNEFRFCGIRMSVNGKVFEDLAIKVVAIAGSCGFPSLGPITLTSSATAILR